MTLTICSRILVPIDFSPQSDHALQYARALASRLGASLELLHVVEDLIAAGAWALETVIPNLAELRNELIAEVERRLQQYREADDQPRVSLRTTVRMGRTAQTITEYADAAGIDLIVMGTHGRTGVAHLVMGSVAERVLRYASCPVLTVRGIGRAREPREQPADAAAV